MITAPTLLTEKHVLEGFACGQAALDEWLVKRALVNQTNGASRTYVVTENNRVIGYYALSNGGVTSSEAPGKIRRNMPDPIPLMILARLAIHKKWQGKGIGTDLLRDAVLRTLHAATISGIRALLVHALDETAELFYKKNGVLASDIRPLTLFLPLYPPPKVA